MYVAIAAGGPSGSGKTSLAHKMANIIGCEVVSLESYYKQVKDFKYDNFSSLDLALLSKVSIKLTLFTSLPHYSIFLSLMYICRHIYIF